MEKIFYLVIDNKQAGPFSIEDLIDLKIKRDSLVWRDGLEDWSKAELIEELKHLFFTSPPPIPIKEIQEILIKTEEPLKIEDTLKKEKITQQKNRSEKTKKKTALEIKRALKFLKFSLIIGILAFLISFIFYDGFKYLSYYIECKKTHEYYSEYRIYNLVFNDGNLISHDKEYTNDFEKWDARLGFYYDYSYDLGRPKVYDSSDIFGHYFGIPDEDLNIKTSDELLDGVRWVNSRYYYKDVNGQIINPFITFSLRKNDYWSDDNQLVERFKAHLEANDIQEIGEVIDINFRFWHWNHIKRMLDFAINKSLYWGFGSLLLVFPIIYIIIPVISGIRRSKEWVDKNSKDTNPSLEKEYQNRPVEGLPSYVDPTTIEISSSVNDIPLNYKIRPSRKDKFEIEYGDLLHGEIWKGAKDSYYFTGQITENELHVKYKFYYDNMEDCANALHHYIKKKEILKKGYLHARYL